MGTETHQHQGSEISQRKEKGAASPAQPSLPSKGWRTALSSLIGGFLSLFKHTVLIIKASSRSASHQNDRTKRGRLPKAAGGRENTKQKRPGAGLPTPREAQESLGFPSPCPPPTGSTLTFPYRPSSCPACSEEQPSACHEAAFCRCPTTQRCLAGPGSSRPFCQRQGPRLRRAAAAPPLLNASTLYPKFSSIQRGSCPG